MINTLKRVYRIVFPYNAVPKHIKEKSIVVGNNSDVSGLTVSLPEGCKGKSNIIIGSDCIINCHIIIYNPDVKVIIGDRVYIGPGTILSSAKKIELGDDILIAWNCTLIDSNSHPLKWEDRKYDVINWKKSRINFDKVEHKEIIVGSKSWIGFNSIIMKGVILGEGSIVAAGSVVSKDVAPFTIVGGNPASFIKNTE